MRKFGILIAVASILVASPAFALICTATDSAGKEYRALHRIRTFAIKHALEQCKANSGAPATCKIKTCGPSG
jgi:hypothetical protein